MKQQQLRSSQAHIKRNGDTLYNDWNSNFRQLIYTNKAAPMKTLGIIASLVLNFEFHGASRSGVAKLRPAGCIRPADQFNPAS